MSRIIRNILIVLILTISVFVLFGFEKKIYIKKTEEANVISMKTIIALIDPVISLSPQVLAGHFTHYFIPASVVVQKKINIEPVKDSGPLNNHNWKYVSTIVQSGQTVVYFKNNQSSRLLDLQIHKPEGLWELIAVESDHFILKEGETLHKVLKR